MRPGEVCRCLDSFRSFGCLLAKPIRIVLVTDGQPSNCFVEPSDPASTWPSASTEARVASWTAQGHHVALVALLNEADVATELDPLAVASGNPLITPANQSELTEQLLAIAMCE